jgi:predicted MFS family arabinose efflux permease
MLLYALWFLSLPPMPPRKGEHTRSPWSSVWATIRDRRVILLALTLLLYSTLDEPFAAFSLLYFADLGYDASVGTLLILLLIAAEIAGNLAAPWLTGRFARRPLALGLAVALAAGVAGMVFLPTIPVIAAGFAVAGAAGAALYTILISRVLTLRPGQAGATSAVVSAIELAAIAAPPVVGAASDHAGLFAGMAIYALIPVGIVALLVAGGSALVREGPGAPAQPAGVGDDV